MNIPRQSLYKIRRELDGKVYDVWAENETGNVIKITDPTDGDIWIRKEYTEPSF